MNETELTAAIAHFWSEWTDDMAPLRERNLYTSAAQDFVRKFNVEPKPADVREADRA